MIKLLLFDLGFLGLMLSFVGTLIVAFSVIKNPEDAYQVVKSKKVFLSSMLLTRFRIGIAVLVVGFACQAVGKFLSHR